MNLVKVKSSSFELLFPIYASLREGGGFCVAKDGRSLRYFHSQRFSCYYFRSIALSISHLR